MPKIELSYVPDRKGTGYPEVFNEPCAERTRRRLGDAAGLQDFGVNLIDTSAWRVVESALLAQQ